MRLASILNMSTDVRVVSVAVTAHLAHGPRWVVEWATLPDRVRTARLKARAERLSHTRMLERIELAPPSKTAPQGTEPATPADVTGHTPDATSTPWITVSLRKR